jgi:hypothetical protein
MFFKAIQRLQSPTMARPNQTPVPHDIWICDICHGPNLIANAPSRCPVCGHARDSCCSNPGDPYPQSTGLFPGHYGYRVVHLQSSVSYHAFGAMKPLGDDPTDVWICECGSESCDWYDACCMSVVRADEIFRIQLRDGMTPFGGGRVGPGVFVYLE